MKKWSLLLLIFVLSFFLTGCSFLTMTFDFSNTETETTTLTTQPTSTISLVNGTISLGDTEYDLFSFYESGTYSLTDIDLYNDVLLQTRDNIRHANIKVVTTLYTETKPYPWSTTTVKSVVGTSLGSGVIFMEDDLYYYALTNHHVINPETYEATYEIKAFEDEDTSEAILVASNPDYDLAVVKFLKNDRTNVYFVDITTRLQTKLNSGELVFAVGNPLSLENNVTIGEFLSMENIDNASFKVILHNAAIHEGSSGGALVDVDGNLIGLNTWGYSENDSLSFSVPLHIIYTFLVNNGLIE